MTISLVTEAAQAPIYPTNRHSARERAVLKTVKTYVDSEITDAIGEIPAPDAEDVTLTVTTETDWVVVPASVLAALDELAARVKAIEDAP